MMKRRWLSPSDQVLTNSKRLGLVLWMPKIWRTKDIQDFAVSLQLRMPKNINASSFAWSFLFLSSYVVEKLRNTLRSSVWRFFSPLSASAETMNVSYICPRYTPIKYRFHIDSSLEYIHFICIHSVTGAIFDYTHPRPNYVNANTGLPASP